MSYHIVAYKDWTSSSQASCSTILPRKQHGMGGDIEKLWEHVSM